MWNPFSWQESKKVPGKYKQRWDDGRFFFFVYLPTVNTYYFLEWGTGKNNLKSNWLCEGRIWQVSEYKEWQKDVYNDREDDMERREMKYER